MADPTSVTPDDIARIIEAVTGAPAASVEAAGRGVTAAAWRVEAPGGPYAVLVARSREEQALEGRDEPARLGARFALLSSLDDPRLPRAVATSHQVGQADPLEGRAAWLVTTWLEGEPAPEAGDLPDAAMRDLGEVLRALHEVPAEWHGPLEDRADLVRGSEEERDAGMLARWSPGFWPFDGRPLVAHPVAPRAPHLLGDLASLREPLLRYAEAPTAVGVCHTDLNASHLLLRAGRLSGLLDLGDAAVVPVAFDLASVAYYFGAEALEPLLEGYEPKRVLRDVRRAEAQQLLVALALQKVEKSVRLGDDARLAHALAVLETVLPLAARFERSR